MTNDSIYIPDDAKILLEERNQLWEQFERANSAAGDLNRLERDIPNPRGRREPVPPPALNAVPDQEVRRIGQEVRSTLQQLNQMHTDIRNTELEIASIEARARSMTMLMVFLAIATIVVLIGVIVMALG